MSGQFLKDKFMKVLDINLRASYMVTQVRAMQVITNSETSMGKVFRDIQFLQSLKRCRINKKSKQKAFGVAMKK